MKQTLYDQFSARLKALPEGELPLALDYVETVFLRASREYGIDAMFPRHVERGVPADRLFEVFDGRTLRDVASVMRQLRGEVADELVRAGTPEDAVHELRAGGHRPRPDGKGDAD